jgi:polyhydroxyalkanoate synthesis regulator phasin
MNEDDLVYRLRKRAEIRRQIPGRKSVEEGTPDRIADILDEAASEIASLRDKVAELKRENSDMGWLINPDRMGQ